MLSKPSLLGRLRITEPSEKGMRLLRGDRERCLIYFQVRQVSNLISNGHAATHPRRAGGA